MKLLTGLVALMLTFPVFAHHSFAVYDFDTQLSFTGTVETLNFRNPHIAMTLKIVADNGKEQIITFVEGAPANMLVRSGLKPDMVKPGTRITAIGSPMHENKNKFFLRVIRLETGEEFK